MDNIQEPTPLTEDVVDKFSTVLSILEKRHTEELQRLHVQYMERVRQSESERLKLANALEQVRRQYADREDSAHREIELLKEEAAQLQERLETQDTQCGALEELSKRIDLLQQERDRLQAHISILDSRIKQRDFSIHYQKKKSTQLKSELLRFQTREDSLRRLLEDKRARLQTVEAKKEVLVSETKELRQQLDIQLLKIDRQREGLESKTLEQRRKLRKYEQGFATSFAYCVKLKEDLNRISLELQRSERAREDLNKQLSCALGSAREMQNLFGALAAAFKKESNRLHKDFEVVKSRVESVFSGRNNILSLAERLSGAVNAVSRISERMTSKEVELDLRDKDISLFIGAMQSAELELAAIRQRLPYNIAMEAPRRPGRLVGLLALPWMIWRGIFRAGKAKRTFSEWKLELENVFRQAGYEKALMFSRSLAHDKRTLAVAYTHVARLLFPKLPEEALTVAREAVALDPRPFRRKWLAFRLFDSGFVSEPHTIIRSLPEGTIKSTSEKNKVAVVDAYHRFLTSGFKVPDRSTQVRSDVGSSILYVTSDFPGLRGCSSSTRTHGLLRALANKGITAACFIRHTDTWRSYSVARQLGECKNVYSGTANKEDSFSGEADFAIDESLQLAADKLYERAKKENPRLVQGTSDWRSALPALVVARRLGVPFIYEVRRILANDEPCREGKPRFAGRERFKVEQRLESVLIDNADHLVAASAHLGDVLTRRGIAGDQISIVEAGVTDGECVRGDCARGDIMRRKLGFGREEFVVGYIYEGGLDRIAREEEWGSLFAAVKELSGRASNLRLLVLVDNEDGPRLREMVDIQEIEDSVAFFPSVALEDSCCFYSSVDMMIFPWVPLDGLVRSAPLSLLRAMRLGIAPLVSDVAELTYIVDDRESGLVHIAGNGRSISDGIEVLLRSPRLREKIGEEAKRVAREFNWRLAGAKLEALYGKLCNRKEDADRAAVPILQLPPGRNALTDQEKDLLDCKLRAAATGGAEALGTLLTAQVDGRPAQFSAFCYLRAATVALELGSEDTARTLASEALNMVRTPSTIRGATRIFYNSGSLRYARDLAEELAQKECELGEKDREFIAEVIGRHELVELAGIRARRTEVKLVDKRVLNILAFSLPHASVGYATRSHGLLKAIRAEGWEVRPYTRPGFPFDSSVNSTEDILCVEELVENIPYGRIFDLDRRQVREVAYMRASVDLYEEIMRREMPSIVHAASNYVTAFPALIAARRVGIPFVYEVRGFWEITRSSRDTKFKNTPQYRFMQLFEGLTAQLADSVITITGAMKEELISRGVSESRIRVAYNSVNPAEFTPRSRDEKLAEVLGLPRGVPVIGYIGSLLDYEGLDDLVVATRQLRDRGCHFRLLLVGDGPAEARLQESVRRMELSEHVIFAGRVPHGEVPSYYSLVDIAPFPRKPWKVCQLVSPIKPYEAMALEKAVVVSDVGALAEMVVNGQTGLVVDSASDTLASALERLLTNPDYAAVLGRQARKWVCEHRTWKRAAGECLKAFQVATDMVGKIDRGRST